MSPSRGSSGRTRALLVLLATVSLVGLFTTRVARKMPDFEVYWTAGSRALSAEPLYRAEDGHFQFKYLPAFAILASPLSYLPLPAAKGAWFASSAVLMLVLLWLSVVALPEIRKPPSALVVITFLAMAKFYAHELVLGQVNLLFGVIVVLAVVQMRQRREFAAGLLLALAVVVKPYAVLFAPWILARRRPPAILGMLAGLAAALALPVLLYGWTGNIHLLHDWWRTVALSTAPNLANQDNVSLAAMFAKWMGPGSAAPALTLCASVLLLGIAAIVVRARGSVANPDPLDASLLLVLIPLLSPQGWDYVFLISTPAVMLLVNYLSDLPRALRLATIAAMAIVALAIYDLVGREAYARFMGVSAITLCALVEFAALATLRFRRLA